MARTKQAVRERYVLIPPKEKSITVITKVLAHNEEFSKLKVMQQFLCEMSDETFPQVLSYTDKEFMKSEEHKTNFVIDLCNFSNYHPQSLSCYSRLFADLNEKYGLTDTLVRILRETQGCSRDLWIRYRIQDKEINNYKVKYFPFDLVSDLEAKLIIPKDIFLSKFELNNDDCIKANENCIGIIRQDNLDKLIEVVSFPNFNINKTILKQTSMKLNLVQVAAQFSAIRCFRNLVINGASLDGVMEHAIRGGNSEIIEIICQNGVQPIKEDVKAAIECHRYEVFDWLIEGFGLEIPEKSLILHRFCHGFDFVDEMCLWDLVSLSDASSLAPVFDTFYKNDRFKEYPQSLLDDLLKQIFTSAIDDNSIP